MQNRTTIKGSELKSSEVEKSQYLK